MKFKFETRRGETCSEGGMKLRLFANETLRYTIDARKRSQIVKRRSHLNLTRSSGDEDKTL